MSLAGLQSVLTNDTGPKFEVSSLDTYLKLVTPGCAASFDFGLGPHGDSLLLLEINLRSLELQNYCQCTRTSGAGVLLRPMLFIWRQLPYLFVLRLKPVKPWYRRSTYLFR